jgi:hypothetical protein
MAADVPLATTNAKNDDDSAPAKLHGPNIHQIYFRLEDRTIALVKHQALTTSPAEVSGQSQT